MVCVLGCSGVIADPPVDPPDDPPLPSGEVLTPNGITRLSALEYDRSVAILIGDDARAARALLPEDARTPFDNDYETQDPSQALVEGEELLAVEAAERLLEDTPRRDEVVGCTPTGVDDATCMRSFARRLVRNAFRREATDEDVAFLVDGEGPELGQWPGAMRMAATFDDFYEGVSGIVQVVLMDPEFLYRVEVGTPDPDTANVYRLNDYEIATRLAFFLWGAIPDEALLDRAQAGGLQDPEARATEAMRMLDQPLARERFVLFHAMWLGYEKLLAGDELGTAMRAETRMLMEQVLFEEAGPWQDLFTYDRTHVNALLAENYGLPVPAGEEGGWVAYDMDERRGLFSHGSFLAHGARNGDTSPVFRGLAVQTRAFCRTIPPPPPGVNTDEGPQSEALCKPERYSAHSGGRCADCHQHIDGVGFGLENFDATGAFRTHESDNPETEGDESTCAIDGEGYLQDVGSFRGPAGLAALGLESGALRHCFVNHVHRLVVGRGDVRRVDAEAIVQLEARLPEGEFTLSDVVRAVVTSEGFGLRREDL